MSGHVYTCSVAGTPVPLTLERGVSGGGWLDGAGAGSLVPPLLSAPLKLGSAEVFLGAFSPSEGCTWWPEVYTSASSVPGE